MPHTKQKRTAARVMMLLVLCCIGWSVLAADIREFDNEQDRARYQRFTEELRCPNCQSQNIAGSNSQVAEDLRDELYRLIREGKSDQEIETFMVQRYGDYILYRPQFKSETYALWLGPVAILLIGLAVAAWIMLKRKPRAS